MKTKCLIPLYKMLKMNMCRETNFGPAFADTADRVEWGIISHKSGVFLQKAESLLMVTWLCKH